MDVSETDPFDERGETADPMASVILRLVQARDGSAEPASRVFSPTEIAVLEMMNAKVEGKTALQKNPHARHGLAWASWIIARMGAWNGYPSSRPPGRMTMQRGYERFKNAVIGWELFISTKPSPTTRLLG